MVQKLIIVQNELNGGRDFDFSSDEYNLVTKHLNDGWKIKQISAASDRDYHSCCYVLLEKEK